MMMSLINVNFIYLGAFKTMQSEPKGCTSKVQQTKSNETFHPNVTPCGQNQ